MIYEEEEIEEFESDEDYSESVTDCRYESCNACNYCLMTSY